MQLVNMQSCHKVKHITIQLNALFHEYSYNMSMYELLIINYSSSISNSKVGYNPFRIFTVTVEF